MGDDTTRAAAVDRDALVQAADYIESHMAAVWGGDAPWLTTGRKVASLVADVLREYAESVAAADDTAAYRRGFEAAKERIASAIEAAGPWETWGERDRAARIARSVPADDNGEGAT